MKTPLAITCLILSLILTPAHHVHAAVIPMPSVQVRENTCVAWSLRIFFTATVLPDSVVEELGQWNYYSFNDHFHAGGFPAGGSWYTPLILTGSPQQKLDQINKSIYGTTTPQPGQVASYDDGHSGTCAADEGLRECVGILVHTDNSKHFTREPYTFPSGVCAGVPPVGTSCSFDSGTAVVDLGVGGPGERVGRTTVGVTCSRPTTYRIQSIQASASEPDNDVYDLDILFGGKPLPAIITTSGQNDPQDIAVRGKVRGAGQVSTTRVLRIDIP